MWGLGDIEPNNGESHAKEQNWACVVVCSVWGFRKLEVAFGVLYNKDYNTLMTSLGLPNLLSM